MKIADFYFKLYLTTVCVCLASVIYSQTSESYFKSGQAKLMNGQAEDAIPLFTKSIELDKQNVNSYFQRARSYSLAGKHKEAVKDYDKVLSFKPDYVEAYISRGSSKNKLLLFKEAIIDFNTALQKQPENQEAMNNRGWAKKGLGDKNGACEDWVKSKKLGNKEAKIILFNNKCK